MRTTESEKNKKEKTLDETKELNQAQIVASSLDLAINVGVNYENDPMIYAILGKRIV